MPDKLSLVDEEAALENRIRHRADQAHLECPPLIIRVINGVANFLAERPLDGIGIADRGDFVRPRSRRRKEALINFGFWILAALPRRRSGLSFGFFRQRLRTSAATEQLPPVPDVAAFRHLGESKPALEQLRLYAEQSRLLRAIQIKTTGLITLVDTHGDNVHPGQLLGVQAERI